MRIAFNSLYGVLQRSIFDRLENIQRDQEKINSGKAVTRPSQDSEKASLILSNRRDLERRQQFGKDAADAERLIGASLDAVGTVQDILSEVGALAVRARSTLGAAASAGVAAQLEACVSRLVEAGNRAENGRYLFGGYQSTTPPFVAVQGTLPGGGEGILSAAYVGDVQAPSFAVSQTLTLGVGVPGTRLSTGAGNDLIATVIALRDAAKAGDTAGVAAAEAQLALHGTSLSQVQAELGSSQSAALSAVEEHDRMALEITARMSDLEDTDVAAVLVDLNKQQLVYQAALQTMAKVKATSLFDYI